jgi:hypothetical protein
VAVPTIAGVASFGVPSKTRSSTAWTSRPAARIEAAVSRLQLQPRLNARQAGLTRSCHRETFGVGRADVLDEYEPAAWFEDAANLAEGGRLVSHGSQHQRRDHGVEMRVGKRQLLSRRADDRRARGLGLLLELVRHRLLGLDEDELGDRSSTGLNARS